MKRIVVTGLGLVTPLACGTEESWARLIAGESAAGPITRFDSSDMAAKVACEVPMGDGTNGTFNGADWVKPKDLKRMDAFIRYGMAASTIALRDSGWMPEDDEARERTGVMIGSGIGGLPEIERWAIVQHEKGPRRVSPFFITGCLINLVSGNVAIKYGFKGPNHAVVTACSSGAHAIGDAARLIKWGDADVMIAGGAESALCPLGIAGFAAVKALSTNFNDEPERASRPWDRDRDGFVMGEGAGIVVLEEYEHAKRRGARIYAEIKGYGLSGDAHHITAPAPDGNGGFRSMSAALRDAGLDPSEVDYVNAHGTSTPLGDEIELGAVRRVFGPAIENISMSSTKSSIGHLLGAAGGVEAIFSILAIRDGIVPPTINLDNPDESCGGVDLVPHKAKERPVRAALSNSFGFGGTNASLVMSSVD
ncbi:MAG: beta-ketoacyl-ACP synthase II [Sphingomonadales bacterium]